MDEDDLSTAGKRLRWAQSRISRRVVFEYRTYSGEVKQAAVDLVGASDSVGWVLGRCDRKSSGR